MREKIPSILLLIAGVVLFISVLSAPGILASIDLWVGIFCIGYGLAGIFKKNL
jgi:hypothetical protein